MSKYIGKAHVENQVTGMQITKLTGVRNRNAHSVTRTYCICRPLMEIAYRERDHFDRTIARPVCRAARSSAAGCCCEVYIRIASSVAPLNPIEPLWSSVDWGANLEIAVRS